ncbi:hypothetical protein BCR43DRAFT_416992, partial [Syncephalastrum racemosum]
MTSFIHEDGLGNMITEDGKDVVMVESDSHMSPVDDVFDYDQYMDLKQPERAVAAKAEPQEQQPEDSAAPNHRSYRSYRDNEKEGLFYWVYEK